MQYGVDVERLHCQKKTTEQYFMVSRAKQMKFVIHSEAGRRLNAYRRKSKIDTW